LAALASVSDPVSKSRSTRLVIEILSMRLLLEGSRAADCDPAHGFDSYHDSTEWREAFFAIADHPGAL
jgi:hypothetical protein